MSRIPKKKTIEYSEAFMNFINGAEVLSLEVLKTFTATEQEQVKIWLLTDTWFTANRILRQPNTLPLQPCHRDFCYAMVQPNPNVSLAAWDGTKERTLLCFRGFGKTTLDTVHTLQCILSCPNIRILLVGGVVAHAEKKMRAVVDLFNFTPVLEHLFPSFTNASVKTGTFTTPARTLHQREATITCASFRSTNASGHYDWLKLDDAANDTNQSTVAAVEKSLVKFDDLAPLLEPNGYVDYIGVRTDAADISVQMFARSIANSTPLGGIEVPVFTLKEGEEIGARHKANKLNLATDVDFSWPQRWNEKTLQRAYTLPNFRENYLLEICEPVEEPAIQPVTAELLRSCLISSVNWLDEVPVINADLSSISPRGTDYCGIIGGFWNPMTKVLTVTRILHQKFTEPSDFLRQVHGIYGDYCTSLNRIRFRVENNRDEEQLFEASFKKQGTSAEFLPSTGHKYERVSTLWDAIRSGKVKFADDLKSRKEWQILVSQVCNFGGVEGSKDDAVDSLAQLWLYCQTITMAEPSLNVPDFGEEAIQPFACRPCDTVKIRHPNTPQQPPEYSDPYYARAFSTGFER